MTPNNESRRDAGEPDFGRQGAKRINRDDLCEPGAETDALAYATIGAALEVHRHVGPGFMEAVYEEALARELRLRSIPFARQVQIEIDYKGEHVGQARLDLLIGGELVVEVKAVDALAPIHIAQALSYLRATGHRLALLLNFQVSQLRAGGIKRVARSSQLK